MMHLISLGSSLIVGVTRLGGALAEHTTIQKIAVIVPKSPFVTGKLHDAKQCLAALDVEKLMEWWPGQPHAPHRKPEKVRDIQRSLDWKRVAQIAAYLLQQEIVDVPEKVDEFFSAIYDPKKLEPGREWPPKISRVVGYERSEYPTFSNILVHVNGAKVEPLKDVLTANLVFDEASKDLRFSVIDGQHRINGAYLAVRILQKDSPEIKWEIPAEIFVDLDGPDEPPRHQAQIFIDVNFYQKKVDRSLVADLFPTARGRRGPLDEKERAQDIGRKLMLEVGPLVGMVQIPGIKYGVKDVVTLSTLNSAIEDVLEPMNKAGIRSLEAQTKFLAICLDAWLQASGRKHDLDVSDKLDPDNVAYQGRILVSALNLVPACIWKLRKAKIVLVSERAEKVLEDWFASLMDRAGLLKNAKFVAKSEFRKKGFLGSGGIGRFRDTLWAASIGMTGIASLSVEKKAARASQNKERIYGDLS